MTFKQKLSDKIREMRSLPYLISGEYPLPDTGNGSQALQFCHRIQAVEYLDFSFSDRNYFFILDLVHASGLDFELDLEGEFATLVTPGKSSLPVVLLDLRQDQLVICYCYGHIKSINRFYRKLLSFSGLTACYFNPLFINRILDILDKVEFCCFEFEQSALLFSEPEVFKAELRGQSMWQITKPLLDNKQVSLNLVAGGGILKEVVEGYLEVFSAGRLSFDFPDLQPLLDKGEWVQTAILENGSSKDNHLFYREESSDEKDDNFICGEPIIYYFKKPIDFIDKFLRNLVSGSSRKLIASCCRRTRNSWRAFLTDLKNGTQIEIDFSHHWIKMYPKEQESLILAEQLEKSLRSQISVTLTNNPEITWMKEEINPDSTSLMTNSSAYREPSLTNFIMQQSVQSMDVLFPPKKGWRCFIDLFRPELDANPWTLIIMENKKETVCFIPLGESTNTKDVKQGLYLKLHKQLQKKSFPPKIQLIALCDEKYSIIFVESLQIESEFISLAKVTHQRLEFITGGFNNPRLEYRLSKMLPSGGTGGVEAVENYFQIIKEQDRVFFYQKVFHQITKQLVLGGDNLDLIDLMESIIPVWNLYQKKEGKKIITQVGEDLGDSFNRFFTKEIILSSCTNSKADHTIQFQGPGFTKGGISPQTWIKKISSAINWLGSKNRQITLDFDEPNT